MADTVNWDDDKSVVKGRWPYAEMYGDGRVWTGCDCKGSCLCTPVFLGLWWKGARLADSVQAYEALHNPAKQPRPFLTMDRKQAEANGFTMPPDATMLNFYSAAGLEQSWPSAAGERQRLTRGNIKTWECWHPQCKAGPDGPCDDCLSHVNEVQHRAKPDPQPSPVDEEGNSVDNALADLHDHYGDTADREWPKEDAAWDRVLLTKLYERGKRDALAAAKPVDDLEELERLAKEATEGPWEADFECLNGWYGMTSRLRKATPDAEGYKPQIVSGWGHYASGSEVEARDLRYIAACSPDRIQALIGRVRETERTHKEFEAVCRWRNNNLQIQIAASGQLAEATKAGLEMALEAFDTEASLGRRFSKRAARYAIQALIDGQKGGA